MSILATIPYYLLSNSTALNKLLENAREDKVLQQEKFWEWMGYTAFMQRDDTRPGHVFQNRWDAIVQKKKRITLSDILYLVADEYLEVQHGLLYAKETSSFGRWQNLRSRMSTLPIKSYFLYKHHLRPSYALAHPLVPRLNDHIKYDGLNELHLHVNEYSFPEENWLYYLYNITAYANAEYREYRRGDMRKHYARINPELTPLRMANRMKLAVVLRSVILELVLNSYENHAMYEKSLSKAVFALHEFSLSQDFYTATPSTWVQVPIKLTERLEQERLMWYRAFEVMEDSSYPYADALSRLLHLYLLLQNEFISLYRHNENQRGFDAFDAAAKHSRPFVGDQAYYNTAIERIVGATHPHEKTCIELRMTPRSIIRNKDKILRAWERIWTKKFKNGEHSAEKKPNLILVAHFIKRKTGISSTTNKMLVSELYAAESNMYLKQAADFAKHAKGMLWEKCFSLGIDAAGSELNLPPEVFAPAFRLFARRTHVQHKTYHCGEDFHHLLSGIRAIYEAITFLELKNGSRIGHATAIGILPKLWLDSMPAKLVVPRSEWALNLIFARKFLENAEHVHRVEAELSKLINILFEASEDKNPSLSIVDNMFDARYLASQYLSISHIICTQDGEYERLLGEEFLKEHGQKGIALLKDWRMDPDVRKRQNELIEVDTDFLSHDCLLQLQQRVQKMISEREIALEALITSNVRISQYDELSQHHILRWLKVGDYAVPGDADMNICMGSDDPGVFVTDIKNEYYHLYCNLLKAGCSTAKAIEHIRRVNETGRIYSFTSIPQEDPEGDFAALFRSARPKPPRPLFADLEED